MVAGRPWGQPTSIRAAPDDHLRVLATANGIPTARADELPELTGIPAAARMHERVSTSLGMCQRLGLAAALLGGDPKVPSRRAGERPDPRGIRWLRGFLRHLSDEGKTILVSSHMFQEVQQTADDIVIINNGGLPLGTLAELSEVGWGTVVRSLT